MMSLNIADALRQKLQEEHDFNAEQANGTLLMVDEMVDNGIDRVLDRISDLESKMQDSIASVRSEMDVRFKVIDDRFTAIDKRFNAIDNQLKTMEMSLPIKTAFFTLVLLAAAFTIFGQ